jgi:hypothetical protein
MKTISKQITHNIVRINKQNGNVEYLHSYCLYGRDNCGVLRISKSKWGETHYLSTDACMSTVSDRFQGIIKYDTDSNYTYQIVELVTTTTVNLD